MHTIIYTKDYNSLAPTKISRTRLTIFIEAKGIFPKSIWASPVMPMPYWTSAVCGLFSREINRLWLKKIDFLAAPR